MEQEEKEQMGQVYFLLLSDNLLGNVSARSQTSSSFFSQPHNREVWAFWMSFAHLAAPGRQSPALV